MLQLGGVVCVCAAAVVWGRGDGVADLGKGRNHCVFLGMRLCFLCSLLWHIVFCQAVPFLVMMGPPGGVQCGVHYCNDAVKM